MKAIRVHAPGGPESMKLEEVPVPAPAAGQAAEPAAGAAPRRPATAAEASVIGKLEPSTHRIMLFGVRRR